MSDDREQYIVDYLDPFVLCPYYSNFHPPPYSRGPSSRHMVASQVHTAVTRLIVSQVYIPPVALGGYVHASRGHVTTSERISLLLVCIFLRPERIFLPTECLMGHRMQ